MTGKRMVSVGVLVMALGLVGVSADAGQRDSHGRNRTGRESQAQGRAPGNERQGRGPAAVARPQASPVPPAPPNAPRANQSRAYEGRDPRRGEAPGQGQAVPRYEQRSYDRRPPDNVARNVYRGGPNYAYETHRYYPPARYGYYRAPRVVVPVPVYPRHYYGPAGNFSVYFAWGNGYLFGAPWSGRVYGYAPAPSYGVSVYYGDVRLQVQPRDAAVYVDGYYAGVVDDFDGTFQRLTLTAGPHQIELDAPGLQPQFFDIYVDSARTITLRADLF